MRASQVPGTQRISRSRCSEPPESLANTPEPIWICCGKSTCNRAPPLFSGCSRRVASQVRSAARVVVAAMQDSAACGQLTLQSRKVQFCGAASAIAMLALKARKRSSVNLKIKRTLRRNAKAAGKRHPSNKIDRFDRYRKPMRHPFEISSRLNQMAKTPGPYLRHIHDDDRHRASSDGLPLVKGATSCQQNFIDKIVGYWFSNLKLLRKNETLALKT